MKKRISPEVALPKIRHFCAYRERCHSEVRAKLYNMGLYPGEVESVISSLIEQDCLNEGRYARLFAGGHFRQKKWGKIKIRAALRQKRVSEANIRIALQEIDATEYACVAEQLAAAKITLLRDTNPLTKQAKTLAYILQKGFETAVALAAVHKILSKPAK